MSERDGYQHGVPCWVDTWQEDAEAAVAFYTELFGWEAEETTPPGSERRHFMLRLRGRDVAAIGSPPRVPGQAPVWGTYVWVDDIDEIEARVRESGGKIAIEPFDALDGGRIAVFADPAGAVFAAWQTAAPRGAQLVNEPGAYAMSQLNSRDPEGAKAFYGSVLGWTSEEFDAGDDASITLWRLPGYVGGNPEQPVPRDVVGVMSPMDPDRFPDDAPSHWAVNFWIDDADAAAETTERLGGKVLVPPYDFPGFRETVLADPAGAAFTVSQLLLGD